MRISLILRNRSKKVSLISISKTTFQPIIQKVLYIYISLRFFNKIIYIKIVGSFAFGLPREAVQFRTWEIEGLRKRIQLLNLLWMHAMNQPISLTEKMQMETNIKKRKDGDNLNFNIDEEEKKHDNLEMMLDIAEKNREKDREKYQEKDRNDRENERENYKENDRENERENDSEKEKIIEKDIEKDIEKNIEKDIEKLEKDIEKKNENEDENQVRRRKTLEAFEKRFSKE